MYKSVVLKNGLRIILADMPAVESLSIGIWISAGGRYETKEQAGISHFLEHMVFKGAAGRSARELKEAIEGRGGQLNAFTGEESTCYLAKVLAKDAAIALDILSDMVLEPRLARSDFLKERLVILEEIKMYIDMPHHYVQEILAELLWPDQPLGMPLAGTPETVSEMTNKDLAKYRNSLYNPQNIVVALAGRLSAPEMVRRIGAKFSRVPPGTKNVCEAARLIQKEPATRFFYKETEQTHVALGIHGYDRFSKDKYALDLLHIILGGNMSSRLFNEVRERLGLAYEISSHIKHYHDTGALIISAGIDNKKVERAITVVLSVLADMRKRAVTREEFHRAKEFYRGQLLMIFEDTMGHMLWLGEKQVSNDSEYRAQEILRRLDGVTIDDIRRVATDIIRPGKLSFASVGPVKKDIQRSISKRLADL